MNKKKLIISSVIAVAIVIASVFVVKAVFFKKKINNAAFKEYISAYTSGMISSESTIKVQLAVDYADTSLINKPVKEGLFDFSPDIKGTAYWVDSRTIEFRPEKKLEHKQKYVAEFYLSKLLKVPDSLSTLQFEFKVIGQAFDVSIDNLKAYDNKNLRLQKMTGTVLTADVADASEFENFLEPTQNDKNLKVTWTHEESKRVHHFQIDSINRKDRAEFVVLKWNSSKIDAEKRVDDRVEVPALTDFKVVRTKVVQLPDQYLLLQFSDPLLEDQDLEGLIRLECTGNNTSGISKALSNLKYFIEDNEIRVYPESPVAGKVMVSVENVKNILNKSLPVKYVSEIIFDGNKPEVRLIGKGNIIPRSNGLILPFEAVNLKAIDVKIIKIYENNIAQFLQVNDLAGSNELYRVGQVVLKKTVVLTNSQVTDFSKWNRFSLDLAELINTEPGAIYKVILSFKKEYSLYPCDGVVPKLDAPLKLEENVEEEDEGQNRYDYYGSYEDDYEGDYGGDYDWHEKDNPCNNAYYTDKTVSRNVLASDIGIIAKRGNDGSMNFFLTDIVTTKPLSDVTLELYSYQHQLLATLKTDDDGMATTTLKKSPYLLVAKKDKQRGYLKIDDGSSLSLSMFDVKGDVVQKGLKGFIYGERGVWRPGDSIYLTFILEDKNKVLPEKHPVSFDLMNPQGQVVKHNISISSINGFYSFKTATEANAPTGNWTARVKVGSSIFSKMVKVETIMPNRLKLNLDFGADKLTKASKKSGQLDVKWLHGGIARNLKADVQVTLSQFSTNFAKYPNFVFDDPSRKFSTENHTVFNGKINENGQATINKDLNVESEAPGVLKASFQTRVFEEGGAFSIDKFSLPYYSYDSYVGMFTPKGTGYSDMLETDKNHVFNIVNLDVNGNLIPSAKLKIDVYKINWNWWWDNSEDKLSNYVNDSYNEPIQTTEVSTVRGAYNYLFRIDNPSWGRFFVRVTDIESGHSTGKVVYVDWPGWSGRSHEGSAGGVTMLSFNADKEKYKVGEKVKLTIPTGAEGRALISIETGSKVLSSKWIETNKGQTEYSFTVTEEMAPNVYAYVTLIQPHAQSVNDLPIRLYGVVPIQIEDPSTHLRPVIAMAKELKPEQNASITVKEETGKAMTYTIAIVDEGLLDITRFKTPDPWSTFYAREALGVKTWDMFDYVMGAYGGELERILSIGGDGEIDRSKAGKTANRFKPMVKFLGPFTIEKGAAKTHTFMMPMYVGSVRVMVIAANNGAYGYKEKTVAVKKPLMVMGTLPRVIGPGESFKLPVDVFAMEKSIKNVSVKVVSNAMISVVGESTKTTSFKRIGDNIVDFDLKASSGIGIGKVDIIATSGAETAKYSVEIDIRNPNMKVVNVLEAVIKPGETWNPSFVLPGVSGTNNGTVEVSSVMPMNLDKRLKYLMNYPHGCIEQTTSSGFPQLYLADLLELSPSSKVEIEKNIKATIKRIISFQTNSGGLSYWPGNPEADDWGTNYAGHFMIEAANKGYSEVSSSFIESWKKYQKLKANQWTVGGNYYNSDLIQAYRLFTLALAKAPELGAMNRLRESKTLSISARWRLAAAYQLAGFADMANKLIATSSIDIKPYKEMSYSYGSDDRDEAMILETLILMGNQAKAFVVAKRVSANLCSKEWMSTQETAYSLLAMTKFLKGSSVGSGVNYSYSINGGASNKVVANKILSQTKMKLNGGGAGKASIKNEGKTVLYARVILEGIPEIGDKTSVSNDLSLSIIYKTTDGKVIDPSKLEQGVDFIAEATITNPGLKGSYDQMALSMVFPSGWEIHNTRMDEAESSVKSSTYSYQDIRDDRVYTYFNLPARSSKTYRFQLNASYVGQFYLPTIHVEAMYDETINARVAGQWVSVVRK